VRTLDGDNCPRTVIELMVVVLNGPSELAKLEVEKLLLVNSTIV
jgi:hypothetical protein